MKFYQEDKSIGTKILGTNAYIFSCIVCFLIIRYPLLSNLTDVGKAAVKDLPCVDLGNSTVPMLSLYSYI